MLVFCGTFVWTNGTLAGAVPPDSNTLVAKGLDEQRAGRYGEAFHTLANAWAMLGPEEREGRAAAALLNHLGSVLQDLGKWDDAELRYRQSIAALDRAANGGDLEMAYPLNNLATLLRAEGRAREAVVLSRRSLELRQRFLAADDASVLTGMANLGTALIAAGDRKGAQQLLERALEGWRSHGKGDGPEAAPALNGLGLLNCAEGRYEKAAGYLARAVAAWSATPAVNPVPLATALANLADLHVRSADHTSADDEYRRAESLIETVSATHPLLGSILRAHANERRKAHNARAALELDAKAKAISGHTISVSALQSRR